MAYPSGGIYKGSNTHHINGIARFNLPLTSSNKAFDTLVKLRKERILAAEELCYIHFQIQVRAYINHVPLKPEGFT